MFNRYKWAPKPLSPRFFSETGNNFVKVLGVAVFFGGMTFLPDEFSNFVAYVPCFLRNGEINHLRTPIRRNHTIKQVDRTRQD